MLISQVPIFISSEIGTSPLTPPADLRTVPANIQAAVISEQSITFESNFDESVPGQLDKIIVLEGPFVAGASEDVGGYVNISLGRNLGAYNALYPAALVRYNPIYVNELTEVSGVLESSITWKISP